MPEEFVADDMKKFAGTLNKRIANVIIDEFSKKENSHTFPKAFYYIITFENPDKITVENETLVARTLWSKDKKEQESLTKETYKFLENQK